MKLYRHLTLLLLTAAALLALWGCVPADEVLRFVPESHESSSFSALTAYTI